MSDKLRKAITTIESDDNPAGKQLLIEVLREDKYNESSVCVSRSCPHRHEAKAVVLKGRSLSEAGVRIRCRVWLSCRTAWGLGRAVVSDASTMDLAVVLKGQSLFEAGVALARRAWFS